MTPFSHPYFVFFPINLKKRTVQHTTEIISIPIQFHYLIRHLNKHRNVNLFRKEHF